MELSADIHKSVVTRKMINAAVLWYGPLPPSSMWTGEHSEPLMSHLHTPKGLPSSPWNAVSSQCSAHSCFAWLLSGVWVSTETQNLLPIQQLYWDHWAEVPNWVCFSSDLPHLSDWHSLQVAQVNKSGVIFSSVSKAKRQACFSEQSQLDISLGLWILSGWHKVRKLLELTHLGQTVSRVCPLVSVPGFPELP